jgi:hypothetical protein
MVVEDVSHDAWLPQVAASGRCFGSGSQPICREVSNTGSRNLGAIDRSKPRPGVSVAASTMIRELEASA